jgi:twinkle protein
MSGSISADAYASRTIGLSAAHQNSAAQAVDIGVVYNAFMQLYSTSNSVLDYLTRTDNGGRGIDKSILKLYRVGMKVEKFRQSDTNYDFEDCVSFPIYAQRSGKKKQVAKVDNELYNSKEQASPEDVINNHPDYEVVKLKYRAVSAKSKQRFYPAGIGATGLFGLNTVPPDAKAICITEGEFDAMSVFQATGVPTVSLPNGVNSLPPTILPWLEKFEKIYLWLDNDQAGQASIEPFAAKLGKTRTVIVKTKNENGVIYKDANEALIAGIDLGKYLRTAKSLNEENILRISDMSENILARVLNFEEQKGIPSGYFKWYNGMLKGFRRGELTIFTGPTGSGKTTFLSQLSLDFLERRVPTLWGSFEVKNEILATTMIYQYSRQNVEKMSADNIMNIIEDFSDLPLYFMKFFGSTDIDALFNTLDYAVYTYDIAHIVLDNLQFMISGQGRGVTKFDIQDQVISALRRFCTERNVHITIVIHPKKVDDEDELSIASVFGSAKATQESDNIMILQHKHTFRYIDVRKNRFDGTIGRVAIGFDRASKRYFQLSKKEEELIYRDGKTMTDIIKARIAAGGIEPDLVELEQNPYLDVNSDAASTYTDPNINLQKKVDKLSEEKSTNSSGNVLHSQNEFINEDNKKLDKVFNQSSSNSWLENSNKQESTSTQEGNLD